MNRMHREDGAAYPNNAQSLFPLGTTRHTGTVTSSERQRHCHISIKKPNKILMGLQLHISITVLPTEKVGRQPTCSDVRYLVHRQRGEGVCPYQ